MRTLRGFIAILTITLAASFVSSAQTVLTSVDGSRVDLDARNGKVVVLAIGAAWLPLSNKQVEFTNALAKRYAGRDVVIYFVATDSTDPRSKNYASAETIAKFATEKKLAVPILRDSDGTVTVRKYKIEQVPSFVILDKARGAVVEEFGGLDPKFDLTGPISRAIDKLL